MSIKWNRRGVEKERHKEVREEEDINMVGRSRSVGTSQRTLQFLLPLLFLLRLLMVDVCLGYLLHPLIPVKK